MTHKVSNGSDFRNILIKNLDQILTLYIESAKTEGTKTKFEDEDVEMLKQKLKPNEIALACKSIVRSVALCTLYSAELPTRLRATQNIRAPKARGPKAGAPKAWVPPRFGGPKAWGSLGLGATKAWNPPMLKGPKVWGP